MADPRALARAAVALALGVVVLFGISRYLLSVELSMALEQLLRVPAALVLLALVTRGFGPILHSTQFYLVLRSLGYDLGFRKTLVGVYSTLALEYVVPVGGATEVGRAAFLVLEGLPAGDAVRATFLHRLAHSAFVAMELAFIMAWTQQINSVTLWLLAVIAATNALNLAAIAAASSRRSSRLLARLTPKLGILHGPPERFVTPGPTSLVPVFLVIALEKASTVLSGHVLLSYLDQSASLAHSLLLFDVLLVTFWLLPIVTPAGVGQVETVQVLASAALGLRPDAALSAVILYRAITLASVLPQLLLALLKYGVGRLLHGVPVGSRGPGNWTVLSRYGSEYFRSSPTSSLRSPYATARYLSEAP